MCYLKRPLPIVVLTAACFTGCGKGSSGSSGSNGGGNPSSLSRGPQVAQVSTTSILVAWRTSQAVGGSVEVSLAGAPVGSFPSTGVTTEHVAQLSGLLPGTTYNYEIDLDGSPASTGHSFTTAPASGTDPYRFCVLGDSGSGGANQLTIAARILAAAPGLVLHTGDVVYESGAAGELDPRYFEPYVDLLGEVSFYPALGNHDVRTRNGGPLLEALYLPRNSADNSEHFYSFDYANAHFAALDSNDDLSAGSLQWTWLDQDLAGSSATWKVVYFHHPPFSSSNHGSSLDIRAELGPLLESRGVDLIFNGHDHNFERTYPMVGETPSAVAQDPSYVNPPGPIYIVTGGGGKSLYASGLSAFTAFSVSTYHFVQVDVEGAALVLRALDANGVVLDELEVSKT